MKKKMKIIISIISIVIIGVALFLVNGLFGNPISKSIAQKTAQTHIDKTYPEKDFTIEDVIFNFKDGYYHANITSKKSIDSHFDIAIYGEKVQYDTYEDKVLTGWNTYQRIDDAYRQMVETVFEDPTFPLTSDIDFGTIELIEDGQTYDYAEADYGLTLDELELDQTYDMKEIAKTKGHIIYYSQDEDVTIEEAAKQLLTIKQILDDKDIPFYAIDFTLEKPRTKDGPNKDQTTINVANFLYSDIHEYGLEERIETAHTELTNYYEQEDAKMKTE